MLQTCPKCHHVRQPGETAPSWQCPACGVAYAKVAPASVPAADNAPYDARSQARRNGIATPARSTTPGPAKPLWLAALAIAFTAYALWNCVQAKRWLTRYGFAFTECDVEREARCEREFTEHGADGTPYLLVRGQPMQNGFDADEFVALLRR
jgi:glutaredoxin